MSIIINRLPADLIPVIVERVAETILSDPNLSNRKAIQYGLLSQVFYEAYKNRPVCCFDASSDSKTRKMEEKHFEEYRYFKHKFHSDYSDVQQLEAFKVTFRFNKYVLHHYVPFIEEMTKPRKTKRLKNLNLSYLDSRDAPIANIPEFVFRVESLEQLGLTGWCLNKEREREVTWPNLKRLCLDSVSMDWIVFKNMIESSCPSLENLEIRDYKGPWKQPGYQMPVFKKLRSLHLDRCEGVVNDFFTDFANQFPRLEELCLRENSNSRIIVRSRSLKKIRLLNMLMLKEVRLDVPNIVQFEFEGYYKTRLDKSNNILPKVSVKTRPEGWTSVIKLGSAKANLITDKEREEFKACFNGSKNSFCFNHKWLR